MPDVSRPIRVLVVDDEEAIVELVGEYLRARGMEVSMAGDGDVALELVRREPPDVVLADLRLPARGGMSILEAIRDMERPVAVVVMTGFGTVETATQAMKLGASDYLLKPVRLREVHEALMQAVEGLRENRLAAHRRARCDLYEQLLSLSGPVGPDDLLQQLAVVVGQGAQAATVSVELCEGGVWRQVIDSKRYAIEGVAETDRLEAAHDAGLALRLTMQDAQYRLVTREFCDSLVHQVLSRLVALGATDLGGSATV